MGKLWIQILKIHQKVGDTVAKVMKNVIMKFKSNSVTLFEENDITKMKKTLLRNC